MGGRLAVLPPLLTPDTKNNVGWDGWRMAKLLENRGTWCNCTPKPVDFVVVTGSQNQWQALGKH